MGVESLAIGGIFDHVHMVIKAPPSISLSDLVKQLKGSSSHFANHVLTAGDSFKWQGSYSSFTISMTLVPDVIAYVNHQEERHSAGKLHARFEMCAKPTNSKESPVESDD